MKKKKEEKSDGKKARVHDDLAGFELSVDQFGQIKSNVDIEKINAFLNKNVKDKKLTDRKGKSPKKIRKEKGQSGE